MKKKKKKLEILPLRARHVAEHLPTDASLGGRVNYPHEDHPAKEPWPSDPSCSRIHNHRNHILTSLKWTPELLQCPLLDYDNPTVTCSKRSSSSSPLPSSAAVQRLSGHHVRHGDWLPAALSARCGRRLEGKKMVLNSGEKSCFKSQWVDCKCGKKKSVFTVFFCLRAVCHWHGSRQSDHHHQNSAELPGCVPG